MPNGFFEIKQLNMQEPRVHLERATLSTLATNWPQ